MKAVLQARPCRSCRAISTGRRSPTIRQPPMRPVIFAEDPVPCLLYCRLPVDPYLRPVASSGGETSIAVRSVHRRSTMGIDPKSVTNLLNSVRPKGGEYSRTA